MADAAAFSLAPALSNPGQVLDYTQTAAAKIYSKAVAPLFEHGYDLAPEGLTTFLSAFDDRAVEFGWEEIISIPKDITEPEDNLILLTTSYGQVSLEQIRAHVNTYIADEERNAQNSFQAFNCLTNSLTVAARTKINLHRDKFLIAGVGVGPLLLKVIIQIAYVDTKATVLHLRNNLSKLDQYMVDCKNDIIKFNDYTRQNEQQLAARGEQTLDLLSNIFKGYMACTDKAFRDFIQRKKDAYEEGDEEITTEDLMEKAKNKYSALVQQGKWNEDSEEQQRIIALQAKIQKLEKWQNKTSNNAKPNDKANAMNKRGNKQAKKGKKEETKKPDWVNTPPKPGETETKTAHGKTYYWCANHRTWSVNPRHTTATCKGLGLNKEQPNEKAEVKIVKALKSVINNEFDN